MKQAGSRSGGTSGRVHRLGEIEGEGRTEGIVSPSELEQAVERGSAREREQRKLIASELAETTGSTLSTDFLREPYLVLINRPKKPSQPFSKYTRVYTSNHSMHAGRKRDGDKIEK